MMRIGLYLFGQVHSAPYITSRFGWQSIGLPLLLYVRIVLFAVGAECADRDGCYYSRDSLIYMRSYVHKL